MDAHARPTHPASAPSPLRAVRLALLIVTSAACLVASAVHLGLTIDVGGLRLGEPTIVAAGIVEGAIGIGLAVAAIALATGRPWARQAIVAAYLAGIVGFLIGITFVARNAAIQTPFNVGVHAGVLPLLVIGSALELVAIRSEQARPTGAR
jgi:hypothetical protein